ncbi:MAG: hypothetical protein AB1679_04335 [Actinomycetota bacterium]
MEFLTWVRNEWDRVAAWVIVALGALLLVLGWVGVTSTPYSYEQIPYVVSGGLGGIFLLGIGAMLWTSADLRDEWRTLRELVELDRVRDAAAGAVPAGEDQKGTAPRPARQFVGQP